MRVIAKKTLRVFWLIHADSQDALAAWYEEALTAEWKTPHDIKVRYPSASILAENRVVFNIKGNTYRIVTKINYEFGLVFIRFVGTHSDYDHINALTI